MCFRSPYFLNRLWHDTNSIFLEGLEYMPRVVRSRFRIARIAGATLWALALMFSSMQIASPGWGFTIISDKGMLIGYNEVSLLLALCAIVLASISYWSVYVVRCRLSENDLMLCTNCGYSLLNLPREGQCPECGAVYEVRNVRYIWARFSGEFPDKEARARLHEKGGSNTLRQNFTAPRFERWRQNTAVAFALHAKSVPRILRRGMWIHKAVVGPLALLLLLSTVYELWLEYALLVLGLGTLALVSLLYLHVGSIRRRVEANDGALCTECGSSLVGQSEQGECPVCGTSFDLDRVRHQWGEWFSSGES